MIERNINSLIDKYLIKIRFRNNNGSGVIFKPNRNSNYCYIFTARHNFEIEDDYGDIRYYSLLEYKNEFDINHPLFNELKIDRVIEFGANIDFIVLVSRNYNYDFWDKIETIKIYAGDLRENTICKIGGFPAINNHREIEYYECKYVNDRENYIIKVESKKRLSTQEINELETNKGISGGGLFVKGNDNQIYILGVEIEYEPILKLVCINLFRIFDVLNRKLLENGFDEVELGGFSTFDKYEIYNANFDLSIIERELENEYIKNIKDKSLDFIIDDNQEINKRLHDSYNKLLVAMGDIANSYLYRGVKLHKSYKTKALEELKKAIKLNKELEIYFKMAKLSKNNNSAYRKIDNKIKRDNQITIDILKDKISKERDREELIRLYEDLLYYLFRYENDYSKDISISIEKLVNLYIQDLDFKDAEKILTNDKYTRYLSKKFVINNLYEIYFHKSYMKIRGVSKKEFAEKLIDLLGLFEDTNSARYKKIREKLRELNIFDDFIFNLREKLVDSQREFNEYKENIKNLEKALKSMKREHSFHNRNNMFIILGVSVILGVLALTNDGLMNSLGNSFDYIMETEYIKSFKEFLYKLFNH